MCGRPHLTPNLAFTPDIQMVWDPALNPTVDVLWVLSLRGRVTY